MIIIPTGIIDSTGMYAAPGPNDTIKVPGIIGYATAPTITNGGAIGVGGSCLIVGTNVQGTITINVGTGLFNTGTLASVKFANSFAFPNTCTPVFSATNDLAAGILSSLYMVGNSTGFDVKIRTAVSISTTYIMNYQVSGW